MIAVTERKAKHKSSYFVLPYDLQVPLTLYSSYFSWQYIKIKLLHWCGGLVTLGI